MQKSTKFRPVEKRVTGKLERGPAVPLPLAMGMERRVFVLVNNHIVLLASWIFRLFKLHMDTHTHTHTRGRNK